jgi:C1A family cysteine protease
MNRSSTIGLVIFVTAVLHFSTAATAADIATYDTRNYNRQFMTGLVRTAASKEFLRKAPRVSFRDVTPVPAKFTLRGKTGSIEDQGSCGSCWDFALTSTLRGSYMGSGAKDPGPLSFNYLLNCATEMDGCDGGDFPAADLLIHPLGAPAEGSDGHYSASQGRCVKAAPVATAVSYKLLGSDLGQHPEIPPPSYRDIAYVVGVLHQPVSVDVAVDSRWQNYSHGIYNGCSNVDESDLNHMVVIEGYDCEKSVDEAGNCVFDANGNLPPGVGTWIVRNSWGLWWGNRGYITTKATAKDGTRCNMIGYDALYFDLK